MAKATITIRQALQYPPHQASWFAATATLFNRVAAFYFQVIQAHEQVLELSSKEALTALEQLTHRTRANPHPVMPLASIAQEVPAMFRRAAIHAALGSAHSFSAHLKKWRARKEKAEAKGKQFTERPPVPRSWNKSATLYVGMWKGRTASSLVIKVWTGTSWNWLKVRICGRALPAGAALGSPSLVRHGKRWWLHTPVEKQFSTPPNIARQVSAHPETKICAADLNLDGSIAVCTVQTAEGTILSTRFIGGGREIAGFRKRQLGRIARSRSRTGLLAEGEQDNVALWRKISTRDEEFAHLVSRRIVDFAHEQGATILVFEHLSKLRPEQGRYRRRGNRKRAFWMKGRIFRYAKYKAWNDGIITSRVSPRNTSRECARCHAPIVRYADSQPQEGYTPGAPLMLCKECNLRGHADRNASVVIGQRLIMRYQEKQTQEKPLAPLATERGSKDAGVGGSHAPETEAVGHSSLSERHGTSNGPGTAHERAEMDGSPRSDMPPHYVVHRVGATPRLLRTAPTEACQKPLIFRPAGVSLNSWFIHSFGETVPVCFAIS
jgi:IS605 OrfB family transposase